VAGPTTALPVLPAPSRSWRLGACWSCPTSCPTATRSWSWWTLFGDIEADAGAAFDKIRTRMRTLVSDVLAEADSSGVTTREAAAVLAVRASEALRQAPVAGS
jgi:ketosteroid isomerase-like protein